jgi:hypothetical protein
MLCRKCNHKLSWHGEKTNQCNILIRGEDGLSWIQCPCKLEKVNGEIDTTRNQDENKNTSS